MSVETIEDLFRYELSEALDLEQQVVPLLERLTADVDDEELKNAIEGHVLQTRAHAERLRRCFELLHAQPSQVTSRAVQALQDDRAAFRKEQIGGWLVLTPFAIGLMEKTEHFEIGVYTGLSRLAQGLEHRVSLYLLEETLWEEQQMARRLDRIGRRRLGITQMGGET